MVGRRDNKRKEVVRSYVRVMTGMQKLDQYYKRSAESDAHIMAMGRLFLLH